MKCTFIIIFSLVILLNLNLQTELNAEEVEELDTESKLYAMLDNMTFELVQTLTNIDSSRNFNVAIMSFDNIGPDAENMKAGETVSEILISTFSEHKNIILTERRRITDIIEEMKLSASGIVSSETTIRVGELAGAEFMIAGSIVHAGKYFNINARILDVASAKVLNAKFIEIPDKEIISVSSMMYDIGKKPMLASFYSMLIPGMGQIIINDRPKKGGFFLLSEAGLLISALALNIQANNEYDQYQENTFSKIDKYDDAQTYYQGANIALGCAGAMWIWNVLDAYLEARSFNQQIKEGQQQTTAVHHSTKTRPFITLNKNRTNHLKIGISTSF